MFAINLTVVRPPELALAMPPTAAHRGAVNRKCVNPVALTLPTSVHGTEVTSVGTVTPDRCVRPQPGGTYAAAGEPDASPITTAASPLEWNDLTFSPCVRQTLVALPLAKPTHAGICAIGNAVFDPMVTVTIPKPTV